jgi:hypothetical protein
MGVGNGNDDERRELLSAKQTAFFAATRPLGFDDDPVVGDQRVFVPPPDSVIRLAFSVMLEVVDRLDESDLHCCDAPTVTGRAIQAAIAVAQASMVLQTRTVGHTERAATHIVLGFAREFLASKPRVRCDQQGEKRRIRWEMGTLMLLAGRSGERLAEWLDCDRSALCEKYKNDLEVFEHKYGHFCKNHKALRRKYQLHGLPTRQCYNGILDREPIDLDGLVDTFGQVLFDD